MYEVWRHATQHNADDAQEKGAFPALQAGHLRALQVYVHADPTRRSEAIETYTFTVAYNQDIKSGTTVAGLELDAPGSPLVSVKATYSAFQSLLLQLMKVCDKLPDLPGTYSPTSSSVA